jgi:uncharacterized protein (DUF2249 family)
MIAGEKIIYLPGTNVLSGGYMHGYITPDDTYCGITPPLAAPSAFISTGFPDPTHPTEKTSQLSIFPNPTHDKFTLVYKGDVIDEGVRVEILDMQGASIMKEHLHRHHSGEFSLGNHPSGLYLVKVQVKDQMETSRLILNK